MPRGDKSAYTEKQKRQAEHIEQSEMDRGASREDAERIGWATVNKQDGGGKASGSASHSGSGGAKTSGGSSGSSRSTARKSPAK